MDKLLNMILEKLENVNFKYERKKIIDAYEFTKNAHKGQYRKSGEEYIIHPVYVAIYLCDLNIDQDTVIAGLLHDVIEDTNYTFKDLENKFSKEIAEMVNAVTKLMHVKYCNKEEQQAETIRRMLIAMSSDIRVIFIKLADRLHNMRTLEYQSKQKSVLVAQETLEIYAPIAHKLGMYTLKSELEDISMKYIYPEIYAELSRKIVDSKEVWEKRIHKDAEYIKDKIYHSEQGKINIEITHRVKNIFGIYNKMKKNHKSFEQIFDFMGIRVLTDSVHSCYAILGIIHSIFTPMAGRFKDYIAVPKPNLYQSIHTTVLDDEGKPLEIQIRTYEMHNIAENGVAAHWKYKGLKDSKGEEKFIWIKQLLEWNKELDDSTEFVASLKGELFSQQVYVYTPAGKIIELPKGSTPIDFAYRIHTEVGERCTGAIVNSKMVPLEYKLNNGEICEIITSKEHKAPSRDWLAFVKTNTAKNRIIRYFKNERKDENIARGKIALEAEARREKIPYEKVYKVKINDFLTEFKVVNLEELYAMVGYGGISAKAVTHKLKSLLEQEDLKKNLTSEEEEYIYYSKSNNQLQEKINNNNSTSAITINNIEAPQFRLAKCCSPVPGDSVIGYVTRGRGITVHRTDCKNFLNEKDGLDRLIEVQWAENLSSAFEAEIQIIANNKKGLLSDINNQLIKMNIEINQINARTTKDSIAIINVVFEVVELNKLNKVIIKLKSNPDVIEVKRV